MKKLFIGLLVIGSTTSFAQSLDADKELKELNVRLVSLSQTLAISSLENCAYRNTWYKLKKGYSVDCEKELVKASKAGFSDEEIYLAVQLGSSNAKLNIEEKNRSEREIVSNKELEKQKLEDLNKLFTEAANDI